MKRKIFAVLLMLVLGMTCVACDMEETVENGSILYVYPNKLLYFMLNDINENHNRITPYSDEMFCNTFVASRVIQCHKPLLKCVRLDRL